MKVLFDKMNPYLLTHKSNALRQYVFSPEKIRVLSGLDKFKYLFKKNTENLIVKLQYTQSLGMLFARRINKAEKSEAGHVEQFLGFVQKIMPSQQAFGQLPRYYRQLFIGESSISRQFLISRKESIQYAEKVLERFRAGFKGGLLIHGDPRSGKTALSRMIASRHFDRKRVFHLNPLSGGTINMEKFHQKLSDSTGLCGGSAQKIVWQLLIN